MRIKPRHGVTVNLYLDGAGFDSSGVCVSCDNSTDTQWQCPFAISEIMPMEEGMRCACKDGCECRRVAAVLDALLKAKLMLCDEIEATKAQME